MTPKQNLIITDQNQDNNSTTPGFYFCRRVFYSVAFCSPFSKTRTLIRLRRDGVCSRVALRLKETVETRDVELPSWLDLTAIYFWGCLGLAAGLNCRLGVWALGIDCGQWKMSLEIGDSKSENCCRDL